MAGCCGCLIARQPAVFLADRRYVAKRAFSGQIHENEGTALEILEHGNEVVFFLVELAVDRAQDIFYLAAGHVTGDAPTE